MVLAPLVRGKKGEHQSNRTSDNREGFVRLRIDGEVVEADPEIELDKKKKHTIEAVVDRLVVKPSRNADWPIRSRRLLRSATAPC